MAGKPKAPFYLAVLAVVAGLVAFAARRATRPVNQGRGNNLQANNAQAPQITIPNGQPPGGETPAAGTAEAHDTASITTVKEYKYKPSEKLPIVKGTAAYSKLLNN